MKVTITAPSLEGVDVQALAQKAWRAPRKTIVEGPITVKGRGVRQWLTMGRILETFKADCLCTPIFAE